VFVSLQSSLRATSRVAYGNNSGGEMSVFNAVLFVHMLGFIGLFGGVVLVQHAGSRLRRASTWEEARIWLHLLSRTPGMLGGGGVLLLLTGLYMSHLQYSIMTPWILVAIVAVVVFLLTGPLMVGPRLRGAARVASENHGTIPDSSRAVVADPSLWSIIFAMNGGALALVWLMTNKPGWHGSIAIVLALVVLGAIAGPAVARGAKAAR
jgi:hypothetical protein